MIRERDKARKILNVIVEYFVLHNFENINASIVMEENQTKISIKGKVSLDNLDFEKLEEELQIPRIYAYDDYYDGLLDSDSEDELKVIGYLVDDSKINLDGEDLTINIIRKHI